LENLRNQLLKASFLIDQKSLNPTLNGVFLMTYEKGVFAQADPGIVSGSTNERKKMSTKTIYKRIALVAVATLGAGVLSVAPASAAISASSTALGATSTSVAVGAATNIDFSVTSTAAAALDVITYSLAVTTKPDDSAMAVTTAASATAPTSGQARLLFGSATAVTGWTLADSTNAVTDTAAAGLSQLSTSKRGTVSFMADKPGVYQLTLTTTASAGSTSGGGAEADVLTVYAGNFIDTDTTTAADKNLACVVGTTITGSTCAGVANGRVGVLVTNLAVATTYYATVTGGSLVEATEKSDVVGNAADLTVANTNGLNLNDGVTIATDAAGALPSDGIQLLVTSAVAGTATIKVETFDAATGVRTVVASGAVTFGAAANLDLASVKVYGTANGTTCATTIVADAVNYLAKAAASNAAAICIYTLNGNGTIKTGTGITVTGNGIGTVATGAAVASETATANTDGISKFDLGGNGLSGTGVWTVSATDGVKTVTGTLSVKYFDSVASIVITQTKWGIKDGVANYDNTSIATFSAKDKNGFPVAFGTAGAGDLVVDSDVASTQTIAVAGDNDSSATETLAASTVSALGVETAGTITVDVSSTMEKVTLKIHNSTNTVPSNTITFHATTDVFSTLVVAAVDAAAGTSQDVTATGVAKITGKTGYIIADSATATFFATSGTLASTSAVNFKNGVATVSYATPLLGGSVEIKATPSETATVASATKKIAIASPANAEIASLTTLVNSLIAKINALNKLVVKIQKKVRA
jgi:trimeric autotransporter adhesin